MRHFVLWFVVVFGHFAAAVGEESEPPRFHTSPYCWSGPRIFSEPRESLRELRIERYEESAVRSDVISPNGAYAFTLIRPERVEGKPWSPEALVFIERPYSLRVVFPDAFTVEDPEWINEQLLYVRVWWGRVAGTDFLLDVEREEIVHRAPFAYGAIAYQQFQQCASPEWRDEEVCRCWTKGDE